jgi:hypothetical protein
MNNDASLFAIIQNQIKVEQNFAFNFVGWDVETGIK